MMDGFEVFRHRIKLGWLRKPSNPASPEKNRTATSWNPGGFTMRMHVGLEDVDDLILDLDEGFERYNEAG